MNNLRVQYIKCFDRTNLIKYLRDENFTTEAEILKPKDIDGMRFLELTELDLVQWRLTPKQKQLILNCRDKILGESTTQTKKPTQKPPLMKRPSHAILARANKFDASFSQELQSRLQLNKTPSNSKQPPNSSPTKTDTAAQGGGEDHNMYIDMTQKTINQPPNVSKWANFKSERMSHNKYPVPPKIQPAKPFIPTSRHQPPPKFGNNEITRTVRPLPKPPGSLLEESNQSGSDSTIDSSPVEEDYLHPEPSRRPLPPPPSQFSWGNNLGLSHEEGNFSGSKARGCPPVPLPPKESTVEIAEGIYEEEPSDPIYEADPLVPGHTVPVMPIQKYDNHRLKSTPVLAQPSVLQAKPKVASRSEVHKIKNQMERDRPSWQNGKRLPLPPPENSTEPGPIWNTSDECGLPKPPAFENKFEQAQLRLIKMLNNDTSNEEFNPNNCPYYRNTDRKGAKQLLEKIPNLADGAFLFRKSDEYFLAITMYHQKRFYNVGLHRNYEGRFYCKTDNERHVMTFKTLQDFIEYYKTHPLTLKMQGSDVKIFLKELLPPYIY